MQSAGLEECFMFGNLSTESRQVGGVSTILVCGLDREEPKWLMGNKGE